MFFTIVAYGQEYKSLINDSLYWDISYAEMGYICSGFHNGSPYRYFFNGADTLINGKTYSKISYYEILSPPPHCDSFQSDTISYEYPYAFLREDILERKVWAFYYNDTIEKLIYDFSVMQGDTLDFYSGYGSNIVVDTIYNIITGDGVERKKYVLFDNGYELGAYVEGIGSDAGMFRYPFYGFENYYCTICVKDKNNTNIIGSNHCSDFITDVYHIKPASIEIEVYPNPFTNRFVIETSISNYEIEIYNYLGQIIFSEKNINADVVITSTFEKGIYFIKIKKGENVIHSQKIIKQTN